MKSYSEMKIYPKLWETSKKLISKDWVVRYKFTDSKGKEHECAFRGMNHLKDHAERVAETKRLVLEEQYMLDRGYNPKTQQYESAPQYNEVTDDTPFIKALDIALYKINVTDETRESMKDPIKLITRAANHTGKSEMAINQVRKRDFRIMLDYLIESGYSNDRYNRVKSNIAIIYNYFVDLEIFEHNYLYDISKLPHSRAIPEIFRETDMEKLEQLKNSNYKLWRFLMIYYCSQSRISELRNLKLSNIILYLTNNILLFSKRKESSIMRLLSQLTYTFLISG